MVVSNYKIDNTTDRPTLSSIEEESGSLEGSADLRASKPNVWVSSYSVTALGVCSCCPSWKI